MKTIYKNGIIMDVDHILGDDEEFGIQEFDHTDNERFVYQKCSINYKLNAELAGLYDLFTDLIFDDANDYYDGLYNIPAWVYSVGIESDLTVSSSIFKEFIEKYEGRDIYRYLYLADCQFLLGSIKNLLSSMEDSFIDYFRHISSFSIDENERRRYVGNDGVIFHISNHSKSAASAVETYFTKAYSILDITSKVCYELQNMRNSFDNYHELKSANVLWGIKKKLRINNYPGTVFERCELISSIESIRHETVHNGTWEQNPRIFIRYSEDSERERYMLYPDMEFGRLSTVKNRRHFFYNGTKINDVLPDIHFEFKSRLLVTVMVIKKIYAK